jgi:hypothetical protein
LHDNAWSQLRNFVLNCNRLCTERHLA